MLFQSDLLLAEHPEETEMVPETSELPEPWFCSAFITLSIFLLDPLKIDVNLPSQWVLATSPWKF